MTRADLDKDPQAVSTMFDQLAERYDLLNDVLSLGQDRLWRRIVAREIGARAGETVLDLAAGTGTSAEVLARDGARVVACDFSLGMLQVGARRRDGASRAGVALVAGDALQLPFADATFDVVTISFGLRNFADTEGALRELLRVTRSGGRLLICEFSHPPNPALDTLYSRYLMAGLPVIARRLTPNPEAYEYLPESIVAWPDQPGLARHIQRAGWDAVAWRNLTFGIVALHRARKL
jgi:demethylmenaquinone methyltransferase / 2-methoxy-6-polyprenyl-1,4-benzoquinol methylase